MNRDDIRWLRRFVRKDDTTLLIAGMLGIFLAVTLSLCARPALAQQQACANRTLVVQKLEERFGEVLQGIGMHRDDGVVELYASPETGTWTILITRPDGMSCLMAAGQQWMVFLEEPEPEGDPA